MEICTSSPTPAPATKSVFWVNMPAVKPSKQQTNPPTDNNKKQPTGSKHNKPTNQPTNQPNQPTNQLTNQPTNKETKRQTHKDMQTIFRSGILVGGALPTPPHATKSALEPQKTKQNNKTKQPTKQTNKQTNQPTKQTNKQKTKQSKKTKQTNEQALQDKARQDKTRD